MPKPEIKDDLESQAFELMARENKFSTSFVQRHLKIGYNRAARIIESLENKGVISPANEVGKRKITDKGEKSLNIVKRIVEISDETGVPADKVYKTAEKMLDDKGKSTLPPMKSTISVNGGKAMPFDTPDERTSAIEEIAGNIKQPPQGHNSEAHDVAGVAGKRLLSFFDRIERLEEEKSALGEDIKEVYAEAKGAGFDVKTMRRLQKLRKMEPEKRNEENELLNLYASAIGMQGTFNF